MTGGFRKPIAEELRRDASLLRQVAHELLDRAFPPSLHAPILEAVGLDLEGGPRQRYRDPRFVYEVLRAYRRRCAMCGFGLRLGDGLVALDAAHIRWHAAEGPDSLDNGLALCALHHRLFDHGALTVDHDYSVRLSAEVSGEGLSELRDLAGRRLAVPDSSDARPAEAHLTWHHRQVFKGDVDSVCE